ncbi:hypothetical protein SAMN06297280_0544 [Arsukibacterium tuosuense]|uniref:DUF5666 domain-containing protein n=1 Tax=Arsukibacterium tuosuense TaxID=1323745 RepID=A0A285I5F5_9GAMM|nr:hypothetical protein [Arsukibacterium tuosuense]SNY43179.1 hypothetical protein SAMN06297280_0544 [Arsukibacterium tuosuense]
MLKTVSTHLLALVVGAAVVYSLTAIAQPGEKKSASSDMSIGVYQIAEELMEPALITKDAEFITAIDSKDGKRVALSLKKAQPNVATSVDYLDLTVNGESIKIDSNGTAVVGDIMVVLVDHASYGKNSAPAAR